MSNSIDFALSVIGGGFIGICVWLLITFVIERKWGRK